MSTYIWFKNGKETQRSLDPQGQKLIKKVTGYDTYIFYQYYNYAAYYNNSLRTKTFYKDNKTHRECDKPAKIYYKKDGSVATEYYYKNGLCHRDNHKPALIVYNTDGSVNVKHYFKNGIQYNPPTKA